MRRTPLALGPLTLGLATALLLALVPALGGTAAAAEPLTVAQALARQDGSSGTVRGYVVGQPTATSTVVTSGFPSDYALALADSPSTTSTTQMLYVQVPSQFRSAWGLRSNPDLLGDRVDVAGSLGAYFSHAGLRDATAFAAAGGTTPTDPPTTPSDPGDYYAGTEGLTGAALEAALHDIISEQRRISYDQVWDALKDTDEDPSNPSNVILLYSGASQAKSTNGGGVDDWNREHVWAKSHGDFGETTGPGTDVHHLRPTDVTVNSTRGNKDFDEGGSPVSQAPGSLTDADSFEPRDADKGDVARMILYMSVRYEGGDGFPDLEVDDAVGASSAPRHGKLSVLLEWNAQDPPSAFERTRNEKIFDTWQGNRNPFIDHPEWADAIWG